MTSKKIAVVGAGIVGVSTAEWLRRDGHDVRLFDRNDPGQPSQTSFGNAGILAASSYIPVPIPGLVGKIPKMLLDPMSPLHLRWTYLPRLLPWLIPFLRRANRTDAVATATALATLVTDSIDQHRSLAHGTAAEAYITPGAYAFLYPSKAACDADEIWHQLRRDLGCHIEFRDRARLLEDDPRIGEHYTYAACHMDHGWITDPGKYVNALFEHFRSQGGGFQQGEVDDIRPVEGGASISIGGEIQMVDNVVLAGGVWSSKLAKKLGHRSAMETERGYHMVFSEPSCRPPFPYMLTDAKFVVTPMEAGIRCAGQVEFGGLEAGPSDAPFKIVRKRLAQLYPDLEWQSESTWLGHRPSTVDSVPFIGPSPKAPQIHFAFGAQHIGLTTGPKTGRLIADMLAGRKPNIDMAPFKVGRFD